MSVIISLNANAQLCFSPAKTYPVDNYPQYVVSADFNGDGKLDLATANNQGTNTLSIILGNGDGTFGTPTNISQSTYPFGIISADFNKDGKADLAVTNNSSGNVAILLGNGDGTFGAATTFVVDAEPRPIMCADFNGDGNLDLAVGNYGSNTVSILLGDGAGGFAAKTDFPVGSGVYSIAIADYNSDGNLDLATANQYGGVSILLGDGLGGFGIASTPVTGSGFSSIVTADFNGDGNADLAVSNISSNNVYVLLGDGAGNFGTAINPSVGNGPYFIVTADFDGDGKADLATTNYYDNNVSILLGDGAGGFAAPVNLPTNGNNAYAIISGDFNGDGKPDLAVTNNGTNTVSIFLSPVANAGPDVSICAGASTNLSASGGATYSWSPATGLSSSTIANPIATPSITTTYILTATSGSCTATDSVVVSIAMSFSLNVSPADTTICNGFAAMLYSSGADSYTWSPSVNLSCLSCANPLASPTVSTTYTVTGFNGACSASDTVVITVGNTSVGGKITATRDTICVNTPGSLTLSGSSGNNIQWQSSTDSIHFANAGDTATQYKTPPLQQSVWYRATVGTGSCSAVSDTLKLFVPSALTASFFFTQTSSNQLTFNSDSSSGNIRSYHWDFGDGQTSAEVNPQHTYAKDTIYYVCLTLYDGSNCSYTFCRYSDVTDAVPSIPTAGQWVIYPNPFTNQLSINGGNLNKAIQNIEMYDVLGRIVFDKEYETQGNSIGLNLSYLAQGMYYLKIKTSGGIYVQPVIKQQ